MGDQQKRILVIQTAFLGDVVLTTPLLTALRRFFPQAYLAVLVIPGNREILNGSSTVDEVILYDKKNRDRGISGFIRIAALLRGKGFDTCVLPHRSFRSGLLARVAGIPKRIGFRVAPGRVFYNRLVSRDDNLHEVNRNLQLLSGFDDRTRDFSRSLWVSTREPDRKRVDEVLREKGVQSGDTLVAIAPGSVWATKRWTTGGFSALADLLIGERGYKVVFVGSSQDRPVVEEILSLCRQKPLDLSGTTSLGQLVALLERCALLVANDNGAMHIGVAQKIPVVAVFGSTTLSLGYGPFTERSRVVEIPLECRPCGKHGHQKCPLGHFDCMNRISPESVLSALDELLPKSMEGEEGKVRFQNPKFC